MNQQIVPFLRKYFLEILGESLKYGPLYTPQSSFLRIDKVLVNSQGRVVFDPQKSNKEEGVYERLLLRNDIFIAVGMNLAYYYAPTAKPGAGFTANSLQDLKTGLTAFGSNLADKVTVDLEAVYNGSLSLTTGTVVTFEGLPACKMKQKHQADTNTITSDPSENMLYLPERVEISGRSSQKFELTFPTYSGAVFNPPATTDPSFTPDGEIGMSLYLDGFLIKNLAEQLTIKGKEFLFSDK